MYGIAGPEGGYIPYVVVPCEKNIGDTMTFVLSMAIGPLTCPLVPWLCCPFDFSDSTISITPPVDCNDQGAIYGATIFWTMQIFNIFGLVFAVAGLAKCAAELVGAEKDDNELPLVSIGLLPDIVLDKLQEKDDDVPLEPANFIRKKIYDVLREAYKKEVAKKSQEKSSNVTVSLSKRSVDSESFVDTLIESESKRTKRQTIDVPIPTLLGHVPGPDEADDDLCERDEVLMDDGDCYELLDQGPCEDDHLVIMDPISKKGFCAPRLCPPGRVFLFNDQLCHDPREAGLCPPGRMVFTSSFGTPLCGCPDGTYEEDDDLDDDVCEPILGNIPNCPAGQVFWFSDFRSPPTCRPDPCKGLNLKRGPEDLPYIPALVDNKCYRVGSQPRICKEEQFYSLSLKYLKGVCSTLDEAGYTILDDSDISSFTSAFGEFITSSGVETSRPATTTKPRKPETLDFKTVSRRPTKITPAGTTLLTRPEIGAPVMKMADGSVHQSPIVIGQSVLANHHPSLNEVDSSEHVLALLPTHMNAFSTPLLTVNGSTTMFGFIPAFVPLHRLGKRSEEDESAESTAVDSESAASSGVRVPRHHRRRRSPLPHASPGNVFEPGLTACRAGAKRDVNAKCRATILPSRFPPSRPVRDVSPVRPRPSCPGSGFWGLGRTCSSSSGGIASIINRLGLG